MSQAIWSQINQRLTVQPFFLEESVLIAHKAHFLADVTEVEMQAYQEIGQILKTL